MRGCFYIITCSFLFLASCNYSYLKSRPSSPNTNLDVSQKISADFVMSTVVGSCLACHSGMVAPDISTLSGLRANFNKVLPAILNDVMPPTSKGYQPLNLCFKAVLKEWDRLGLPETTALTIGDLPECSQFTAAKNILDMPLTYETFLTEILQKKCLSCHNIQGTDTEAAGILFAPFSEIESQPRRWMAPGATNKVVKLLRETDEEKRMPPPEAGPRLSDDEILFVERWIDHGKPQ